MSEIEALLKALDINHATMKRKFIVAEIPFVEFRS
jgi:hypothetical protein